MKTILFVMMSLFAVGCATSVETEESDPVDCEEEPDAEECDEPPPPVEENEGARCAAESDCDGDMWCVITPETGPDFGVCRHVG